MAQRFFADLKPSDKIILPGSNTVTTPFVPRPPVINLTTPAAPSSATVIPPQNVPLVPPTPQEVKAIQPTPSMSNAAIPPVNTSTPPPLPPPSPPPRKRRRGRNFFLFLLMTLGLGYAGGIYYSLVSDNFHDFFTEYVPYGEEAVLYFEEREYKRRYPARDGLSKLYPQKTGEPKTTIKSASGISARIAQDASTSDSSAKGRHTSSLEDLSTTKMKSPEPAAPRIIDTAKDGQTLVSTSDTKKVAPDSVPKVAKSTPNPPQPDAAKPQPVPATDSKVVPESKTVPESQSAPAAVPPPADPVVPIAPIDVLYVVNAADPVVQEITKILNDVIAVVNADKASNKYATTMTKAKEDVTKLAKDIALLRESEAKATEEKIRASEVQFDNGAKELVRRIEQEMKEQEMHWREEYEAEREKLSKSYQDKLKAEAEVAQKIAEQRLRNTLLEQDIKLKGDFATAVQERVETERSGRLSKIGELSKAVSELEDLTSQWNEVVDTNLRTQHLVVAVDAVKSAIESADRPTPFLHELAALKELANEDAVVDAAVASINPIAYQLGLPTSAQLIDRFRRVANEVRKAALLPEDAGVASHATSLLLSKMMFKKNGLAVGDDVESVLTRTETLLEEGNLDDAAREMNSLQGWAKVLSRDWLTECRKVLEVKQALEVRPMWFL